MNLTQRLEMIAAVALQKIGRRAYDDEGALSTEMMLLAAIVTIIAIAAGTLLFQAMQTTAGCVRTDAGAVATGGGANC